MYETFYGLRSRPFQLTPDPHYYFESLTHRKALSYLGYGLAQGEGFIVITGEVGAGKTTLVGHLMQTIDKARLTAANIVTTKLDSNDIVRVAAGHFGIDTEEMDKAQLLGAIEEFLHAEARAGRRCLLIVDESQNLTAGALEELRMLSNFQLGGQALLQIFLLGQPEFRDMLQNTERLEQLRQRVIAHHHLEAMEPDEIEPYITHRLSRSGWSGRPKITSDVFALLYSETEGVPRKINNLMSRVLLMGAVERAELIDQSLVGRTLADMNGEEVEISVPPASPPTDAPATAEPFAAPAPAEPFAAPAPAEPEPVSKVEPVEEVAKPKAEEHEILSFKSAPKPVRKEEPAATEPVANAAPAKAPADRGVSQRVDVISKRLSLIESRMDGQEENLHRVLTMLVTWVESEVRKKEDVINAGRAA